MEFISENIIEKQLIAFENIDTYTQAVNLFWESHLSFSSYFTSENFKLLTEEEYDLMVFILVTIWSSILQVHGENIIAHYDLFETEEEKNWEKYNETGKQNFNKTMDLFFDKYEQEDLLAFIEDTCILDKENPIVTSVGAPIIVITTKSWVDMYHQSI